MFFSLNLVLFAHLRMLYGIFSKILFIFVATKTKNKKNNMSHNLLAGKRGLIFGALNENSIAWKVAEKAVEEGAQIVLTNAPIALRSGEIYELAKKTGSEVIPCDATSVDDLSNLFTKSQEVLGGKIDFVLHSIGMSPNIRKSRSYADLDYNFLDRTINVSAISFHKMMQVAYKNDAIAEGGSILALSYIAGQRTYAGYSDMADAKALLESIARSFGSFYGSKKKVRVNTISQSPTRTTAGNGISGFNVFYDVADSMSPLGNADSESCADYCVTMFSDLTRMVTMQNLYHDGGYSTSGMSIEAVEMFSNQLESAKK